METVSHRLAGLNTSLEQAATPNFIALCELHGVQIVLDDHMSAQALDNIADTLAPLGARRTIMVLGLPETVADEEICATLAPSFASAESFVLFSESADASAGPRNLQHMVCEALPHDRLCVFATNAHEAIRRAWQRVRAGDRLVLLGTAANIGLELLPVCPEPIGGDVATLRDLLEHTVGQE